NFPRLHSRRVFQVARSSSRTKRTDQIEKKSAGNSKPPCAKALMTETDSAITSSTFGIRSGLADGSLLLATPHGARLFKPSALAEFLQGLLAVQLLFEPADGFLLVRLFSASLQS